MITLTIPVQVPSVLGSSNTIAYDKLVLDNIIYSPVSKTIRATAILSVSSDAAQNVIQGVCNVSISGAYMELIIAQLNFQRRIALTGPQVTTAQSYINTAQNQLESAVGAVGLVAGAQTTGA